MEEKVSKAPVVKKEKKNEFLNELKAILGSEYQSRTILGFNLLSLFKQIPDEEDKLEVYEYMLTNFGDSIPPTGKVLRGDPISDETWELILEKNMEYIIAVFNRLVHGRPSPRDFAKGIHKLIEEFEDDTEKIIAISLILAQNLVPYVQIPSGGKYVPDKRLSVLSNELRKEIKLLNAIEHSKLKNQTQMASLMLGVVNSGQTDEEKAVLMTAALTLEYRRGFEKGKNSR